MKIKYTCNTAFKVGDVVIVKQERLQGGLGGNNAGLKNGYKGKITRLVKSGLEEIGTWAYFDRPSGISIHLLRHATTKEKKEYENQLQDKAG